MDYILTSSTCCSISGCTIPSSSDDGLCLQHFLQHKSKLKMNELRRFSHEERQYFIRSIHDHSSTNPQECGVVEFAKENITKTFDPEQKDNIRGLNQGLGGRLSEIKNLRRDYHSSDMDENEQITNTTIPLSHQVSISSSPIHHIRDTLYTSSLTKKQKLAKKKITQTICESNKTTIEDEPDIECEPDIEREHEVVRMDQYMIQREIMEHVKSESNAFSEKLNEYAKNTSLVWNACIKWINKTKKQFGELKLFNNRSIRDVIDDNTLSNFEKTIFIDHFFVSVLEWIRSLSYDQRQSELPIIHRIKYYTIEKDWPDGKMKTFAVEWNSKGFTTILPEIVLRAIPFYQNDVQAFFENKFIPFKQLYVLKMEEMSNQYEKAQNELDREDIQDKIINYSKNFKDSRYPEVDCCTLYTI